MHSEPRTTESIGSHAPLKTTTRIPLHFIPKPLYSIACNSQGISWGKAKEWEKALVSVGHVSSVNIPKNLEYTDSAMLSYKKLFQKDFRQAAMDIYSRTMHANEITTSWKLFCPVSYTMRALLVFPPLSFSKLNSLGQGCMRDRANKAYSANCCD